MIRHGSPLTVLSILLSLIVACSSQPAPATPSVLAPAPASPTLEPSLEPVPSPTARLLPSATPPPTATATPPPTAMATPPPPRLLAEANDGRAIAAIGPLDPDGRFLPLLREGSSLDLLPLEGGQPLPAELAAEPVGWSYDGQLFAYRSFHSGAIEVLAPSLSLTTTMIEATPERQPVAGAWIPGSPFFTYLSAEGDQLALYIWRPERGDQLIERIPAARLAGASALAMSHADQIVVLPLLRSAGQQLMREWMLIDITDNITLTLATAPGEGPMSAAWGPRGELAFSVGGDISIFLPASGQLISADVAGLPQDWGSDGLLIVDVDGRLVRWRQEQGVTPVTAGGAPVIADYHARAAAWVDRGLAVVLREGSLYHVTIP